MLQNFRDNLKGTVAIFLVGIISVPFIFFGVDSLFTGGAQAGKAAEVNGEAIANTDVERAIRLQRDQMTQRFGDQLPADFLTDEKLRGPALEGLVDRQLKIQAARQGRMTVSDKVLDELIVSAPTFQTNGQFDAQRFTYMVQSMGYTPAGYREMIRQEIIAQQYASAVAFSGFVTEKQLADFVKISEQTRDFYYVTLPLAPALEAADVSQEEVQAYYDANQSRFQEPEKVIAKVVELNVADIAAKVEITDAQVAAQYEQNMKSFESAPVRQVAHILVEAESEEAAKDKLAEVRAALDAGEDFAEVAKRLSDDIGTKEFGGDLGFTSGDTFPEAFEQAVAALAVGEVSAPVQTDAGFHVIKLIGIDEAEKPSLEEEAPLIRTALADSTAQQRFVELLEELKEKAYNTSDINEVAEALDLTVQSFPAFTRSGGQGLAADPRIVEAAFTADVLKDGHISPVIELNETSVAIVSVTEHIPATVKPLEEVNDLILAQLKDEKAKSALAERSVAVMTRLQAGEDVEAVAKDAGLEWQVSYDVKRADARYDRALLQQVFDLPRVDDTPGFGQVTVASGDLVLVKLTKVADGNLEQLPEEQRQALKNRLAYQLAGAEMAAFDEALKSSADISIY